MEKVPPPQERFTSNMVELTELLKDLIVDCYEQGLTTISPTTLEFASSVIGAYDSKKLIESFIEKSHIYWDKIKKKDKDFFLSNTSDIFDGLPDDTVNAFKLLFSDSDPRIRRIISIEEQEDIWAFFESFVRISIVYAHEQRNPITVYENGKARRGYTGKAFEYLAIKKEAKKHGIDLKFPNKR